MTAQKIDTHQGRRECVPVSKTDFSDLSVDLCQK